MDEATRTELTDKARDRRVLIALVAAVTVVAIFFVGALLVGGYADRSYSAKPIVEIITALGTLGAAVFAAISAFANRDAARASLKAAENAEIAAENMTMPRIAIYADNQGMYPRPVSTERTISKHAEGRLKLENTGRGTAAHVTIAWDTEPDFSPWHGPVREFMLRPAAERDGIEIEIAPGDEVILTFPGPGGPFQVTAGPYYEPGPFPAGDIVRGGKKCLQLPDWIRAELTIDALLYEYSGLEPKILGRRLPSDRYNFTVTYRGVGKNAPRYSQRFRLTAFPSATFDQIRRDDGQAPQFGVELNFSIAELLDEDEARP